MKPRSASSRGSMSSTRVVVDTLVEPLAADDAQARAIRAAQRGDRLGQVDGLADRRLEVELVVVGQAGDVRFVVGRQRSPGRQVERGQVFLLDPDVDRVGDVAQAAAALEGEGRRQAGGREDAPVGAQEPDAAGDRCGEREVVAEVDPDVVDGLDPVGAGVVGEQSRDVPGERAVDRAPVTVAGWTAPRPRLPNARPLPSREVERRRRRSPRAARRAWRSPS